MARPTGYPVKIINPEVLQNGLSMYGLIRDGVKVLPIAVVKTKNGLATVCSEGVGWEENQYGELVIEVWVDNYMRDYIDVPKAFVIGALTDGTEVELADFIRTFGARLENNFHTWKNQIEGVPQVFDMEGTNA